MVRHATITVMSPRQQWLLNKRSLVLITSLSTTASCVAGIEELELWFIVIAGQSCGMCSAMLWQLWSALL